MFFSPVIPTITLIAQVIIEYATLTRRKPLFLHFVVRAISLIIGYGGLYFLNYLGVKNFFSFYLLTAAYIGACVILFEESLAQKVFLYFTDWGITSFVSSVCAWIAFWLAGGTGRESLLRYALYASSFAILIPLYMKLWRNRVKEMLALFEKGNPFYAAYPVLTFVVFGILFGPTTKPLSFYWFVIMLLFEGIVLFSYYLIFSQIYAVFNRMQAEEYLRNSERQVLLQKKYYEQVDIGIRKQREMLHDTRHHLVAMASLMGDREYDSLDRYIQRLLEKTGREYSKRFCDNTIANAIIGGYIKIAEEKGISISVELDLPQDLGMDDYELCTIFGNTIENAIEACQRIPAASKLYSRRFIGIKSKVDKGRLIVRIENAFDNDIKGHGEAMQSSKGSLGGIGLESVRNVAARYGGSLSCASDDGVFILSAVLCLRPSGSPRGGAR